MKTMKAAVSRPERHSCRRSQPTHAGLGEAVIRVTLTTICGTDSHRARSIRYQAGLGHRA